MLINDLVLQNSEKLSFKLRELYSSYGYKPYHMSKFEEYDLYAKNKDFLVSDNVITFNDPNGKLMALKPDVTLSIIKNSKDTPNLTQKIYYNENVYRVSENTNTYKEIPQTGIECFGYIDEESIFECVKLAIDSLRLLSGNVVLSISNLDILKFFIGKLNIASYNEDALIGAINTRNESEIDKLINNVEDAALLKSLLSICGPVKNVLNNLEHLLSDYQIKDDFSCFINVLKRLSAGDNASFINLDFSVTGDFNYYNGIIFQGFINGVPTAVVSGGQYDNLMKKLFRKSSAVGFAVYADVIDEYNDIASMTSDNWINVALPKGRLGEVVYELFEKAGYECPSILEQNRKLVFENQDKKIRYFWVKPSDVAIYVERGVADIGVAGKDIIEEQKPNAFELLDLKRGVCRMAVAAPVGYIDYPSKTLRVATKFPAIASDYYQKQGRDIDIVKLNGSIEIAPILGLTDVIVDIVETGTTLKENNLEVIDTIFDISARLIANRSSYKFKREEIENIVSSLKILVEDKTND